VARQETAEQVLRPAFQRLGQKRVVGVGQQAARDLHRLVEGDAVLVMQQAHQFRPGDGGMGVVELDRHLLRQAAQIAMFVHEPAQDVGAATRR
jgi:hypothetical protein